MNVWDVIGRSIIVTAGEDDLGQGKDENSKTTGNSGKGILWGIIARSAGTGQNTKKVDLLHTSIFVTLLAMSLHQS